MAKISTRLVLFDKVHVKQVSGPPPKSRVNDYDVLFPRNEEGKVNLGIGVYETNNQRKKATFKCEQEGQFCLSVAKVALFG